MKPYGSLTFEPAARLTEIEWLLDSGEDVHAVAARLGVTPSGVERAVQRSGRVDLLAKIARGRTL